jgi:AcrR family transcriptional regulator
MIYNLVVAQFSWRRQAKLLHDEAHERCRRSDIIESSDVALDSLFMYKYTAADTAEAFRRLEKNMGIAERQKRDKNTLRLRILEAAREIIREEGHDALTIRKIGTRIEYSPMALYNHFKDKQAILLALAHDVFLKLERMLPKPKPEEDPVATLRVGLLAYIEFGLKHSTEYEIVFMSRLSEQPASSALVPISDPLGNEIGGRIAFERLVAYVQGCIGAGAMEGDPFAVARVLWTGIHGCVSLQIAMPQFVFGPKREFAEGVVDVLIRGTTSPGKVKGASSARKRG